ncbi:MULTISPECIES: flagellar biosynthesis repressor FlbT [unclassified Hyphomicrobium]|uniref:flagellar biosynthesis repressor FlbT n=1 Tax=unclassified Hyphomicrobium TaxID=2619925 RepID=UPI000213D8D5|nr:MULTISPECIES: flagellar biosynthesis repressor FlbT [unclassified Hyphomicrobium]CCB67528.1 Flagellar FlbT family protein [Hyphomicrobium sp. MC1]
MAGGLKITLRAGERIFINGGVLRVDRKVSLELMNDVVFLLEQHVMKPEDTTTPLRQLYFMIQMMLMDPALYMKARTMARESVSNLSASIRDPKILDGLREAGDMLDGDRPFDALKKVRTLLPLEVAANASEERSKEVA